MARQSTEIPKTDALRNLQLATAKPSNEPNASSLYAFYVVDLDGIGVVKQFGFDIPPQTTEMDEDAAADAVALQEGGVWTDERGQYFKMVTLGGTFGFRPTRSKVGTGRTANIQRSINQAQNAADVVAGRGQAISLPPKERTGYDRYRDLHNLIRFYWDQKKLRSRAARYIFVYADWKMGEVYLAQPMRFRRSRNAPADRYQIKYNLTLRLLAPMGVTAVPKDFLIKPDSKSGLDYWLKRLKAVGDALEASVSVITQSVRFVQNLGRDIVNAVLEPINDTISAIRDVVSTVKALVEFPLEVLRSVHRTCLEVASLLDEVDRNILAQTSGARRRGPSVFEQIARQYKQTAWAIAEAFIGITVLGAREDVNATASNMRKKYKEKWARRDTSTIWNDGGYGALQTDIPKDPWTQGDRGSNTAVGSKSIPKGAKTITLPARTSIKALSVLHLGYAGRWKEIVLLNRLSPPYISSQGDGVTVLRPGDPIKIPTDPQNDDVDVNQVFSTQDDYERLDAYKYGRDLLVDPESHDFVVDDGGDLAVVEGLENLKQAMLIKIWTRPGELKLHPWFGFGARPGEGIAIDLAARYHLQLRDTVMSDTRVEKINSLSVEIDGDTLRANVNMTPKEQEDSIDLMARAPVR